MTWEQKLQACQALGPPVALNMRAPGNWYASQSGVHIADNHMETHKYGNGKTPQDAADDHFKALTVYQRDEYVVVRHCGKTRTVQWNGFMWFDIDPEQIG